MEQIEQEELKEIDNLDIMADEANEEDQVMHPNPASIISNPSFTNKIESEHADELDLHTEEQEEVIDIKDNQRETTEQQEEESKEDHTPKEEQDELELDFMVQEDIANAHTNNVAQQSDQPSGGEQEDVIEDEEKEEQNDVLEEQKLTELQDQKLPETVLSNIDVPNLDIPTQIEVSIDPPHDINPSESNEEKDIGEDIIIDDNWNNDIDDIDIDDNEELISSNTNNEEKDEEEKSKPELEDNSNKNAPTGFFMDTPRKDLGDEDIFKFNPSNKPSSVIEYEEVGEELIEDSSKQPKEYEQDLILAGGESDQEDSEEQKLSNDQMEQIPEHAVPKEEMKIENTAKELVLSEDINNEDLDGLGDDAWGADIELDIDNDIEIDNQDELNEQDEQIEPIEDNIVNDINLQQNNEVEEIIEAPIISNPEENKSDDIDGMSDLQDEDAWGNNLDD